jgi:NADH:ubiquinone oxidoreductase subunit F (NADH-binding)
MRPPVTPEVLVHSAVELPLHELESVGSGLPRLLLGVHAHEALTLAEHRDIHGELHLPSGRGRRGALIAAVEHAGLRGRGGAAFPTGTKMRAVANSGRRPLLVVNATEGEPASAKDHTLMTRTPHLVLDGAAQAALALGAHEVMVCVCAANVTGIEAAARAIAERAAVRRRGPRLTLKSIPAGFLSGQETALVDSLNGGPGLPTFAPPRPFERGVGGRPTLVSNAETFAHIALIAHHGPDWFRELGSAGEPGSLLVTVTGAVAHSGVYEIEPGIDLASLVHAAGGVIGRPRAALIGGYGGSWIGAQELPELRLSERALASHGATLGAGVVLLLEEDACPVAETREVLDWMASQGAGQCGPCRHGLSAIAREFALAVHGLGDAEPSRRLEHLAARVRGRGACAHPDGVSRLLLSALRAFPDELEQHAAHGLCVRCRRRSSLPGLG